MKRRPTKLRVLVADDNEDNRVIYAEYFTHLGHDVDTASDGAEAMTKATSFQPDIVLLDLSMPTVDG